MNWLVKKCEESNKFAWGLTYAGIILALFIAFWGR